MKWSLILSASSLLAALPAAATPMPLARRDISDIYRLRVSTSLASIDGHYLSDSASAIAAFASAGKGKGSAIRVFTNPGSGPGLYSLHTYPVGIIDHALGLVGGQGYYDFDDLTQPEALTAKYGTDSNRQVGTASWQDFRLGKNGTEVLWGDADASPGWIAMPNGTDVWLIKHYDKDGGTYIAQNYVPVQIFLEHT